MKFLQTSLALLALFALMLPCAHAEELHHNESVVVEGCAANHTDCHSCSSEPCSKPSDFVRRGLVSFVEIPMRQIQLITVFKTDRPIFVAVCLPPGVLRHLQTVQLLI